MQRSAALRSSATAVCETDPTRCAPLWSTKGSASIQGNRYFELRSGNIAASEANKIFIDILTGASAGGMSATVLAQKLFFEAGSLTNPYDNILYRAWVEDIRLEALLAPLADRVLNSEPLTPSRSAY